MNNKLPVGFTEKGLKKLEKELDYFLDKGCDFLTEDQILAYLEDFENSWSESYHNNLNIELSEFSTKSECPELIMLDEDDFEWEEPINE